MYINSVDDISFDSFFLVFLHAKQLLIFFIPLFNYLDAVDIHLFMTFSPLDNEGSIMDVDDDKQTLSY